MVIWPIGQTEMTRGFFSHAMAMLLCLLAGCSQTAAVAPAPVMRVMVTVDWEGWSLDEENLQTMREFRQKHPHIPMVQFLNPVYAIKFSGTESRIKSTLLPADTHGLHLHAWKALTDACHLTFQAMPAFDPEIERCEAGTCGYSVSLEYAYDAVSLHKLVACSTDLLVKQGFHRPRAFRAGGWQLGPKLAQALKENGFHMDSSRMPATHLQARWGSRGRLIEFVQSLHPEATLFDKPYELLPGLMEYPNNASLADYTSADHIVEMFEQLIARQHGLMVLGFHQETAFNYLPRLEDAIPRMEAIARQQGIRLQWVAYPYE